MTRIVISREGRHRRMVVGAALVGGKDRLSLCRRCHVPRHRGSAFIWRHPEKRKRALSEADQRALAALELLRPPTSWRYADRLDADKQLSQHRHATERKTRKKKNVLLVEKVKLLVPATVGQTSPQFCSLATSDHFNPKSQIAATTILAFPLCSEPTFTFRLLGRS